VVVNLRATGGRKVDAIKRVLVTGGTGKAGKWVVAHLQEHGYDVANADLRKSDQVRTYLVDLCDLGQVFGVAEGMDAIVHLAAIPWPGEHSPEVVFRNNVMSTFNVLQTACVLGVRKVVFAGSESALGFPFSFRPITPIYLPIDEGHPLLAQDAYGISKIVIEEVGSGYARRDPEMSIICLRLSYIIEPQDFPSELRQAWADPKNNIFNLWAYVDARDVALSCRLAIESPRAGYDAFYIAAPDTLMQEPTLDLVNRYFPELDRFAEGFGGRMSTLDVRRAAEVLGFRAEYVWNDMVRPEDVA
jgi:nucleoside-diphosphate-sugar epimerase